MGGAVAIRTDNIQGNILTGYGGRFPAARFLYLRVTRPRQARAWIGRFSARMTLASTPLKQPAEPAYNIAISHAGLAALKAPHWLMDRLPPDFVDGMARRAESLADTGANSPGRWLAPWGTDASVHVLISIYGSSDAATAAAAAGLLTSGDGLKAIETKVAGRLKENREHFGFIDGFGQPNIEGVPRDGLPAAGYSQHRTGRAEYHRHLKKRNQPPLKTGELLLGYTNLASETPPVQLKRDTDREGYVRYAQFMRDGTFMVFRDLAQDVALFRAEMARAALSTGLDAGLLAARIVGRWPDGTPLAHAPTEVERKRFQDGEHMTRMNDFRYGDDPDGLKCPLGAHIRRANPRDSLGLKGRTVDRHRIVRRGIPYGPPYDDDPGAARGIIFIALNASISGQFEIVQREWLDEGRVFGMGAAADPLVGNHTNPQSDTFVMSETAGMPKVAAQLAQFVTLRGGDYFFVPARHALEAIAEWKRGR